MSPVCLCWTLLYRVCSLGNPSQSQIGVRADEQHNALNVLEKTRARLSHQLYDSMVMLRQAQMPGLELAMARLEMHTQSKQQLEYIVRL